MAVRRAKCFELENRVHAKDRHLDREQRQFHGSDEEQAREAGCRAASRRLFLRPKMAMA